MRFPKKRRFELPISSLAYSSGFLPESSSSFIRLVVLRFRGVVVDLLIQPAVVVECTHGGPQAQATQVP